MTDKVKHTTSLSIYSRVINFDPKLPKRTYQWEEEEEEEEEEKEN